jgi:hypothetical protein
MGNGLMSRQRGLGSWSDSYGVGEKYAMPRPPPYPQDHLSSFTDTRLVEELLRRKAREPCSVCAKSADKCRCSAGST